MVYDFSKFFHETLDNRTIPLQQYKDLVTRCFKLFGYNVEFYKILDRLYITVRCDKLYIIFIGYYVI